MGYIVPGIREKQMYAIQSHDMKYGNRLYDLYEDNNLLVSCKHLSDIFKAISRREREEVGDVEGDLREAGVEELDFE